MAAQSQAGTSSGNTGTAKRMKVKYNKIPLKDLEFEKGDKVWLGSLDKRR